MEKRQLEFLEDTVKYYSEDVNRRCVSADSDCFYSPKSISKEEISEGCAIGRHLTDKLKEELDKEFINETVLNNVLFNKLPNELRVLGKSFLEIVQRIHDNEKNWDEGGLTRFGELYVKKIKRRILLGDFKVD